MNRTFDIVSYLALLGLCLVVTFGCSKVIDAPLDEPSQEPEQYGTPISFRSSESATKAEFYGMDDLYDGVQVYGSITSTAYPNGFPMFGEDGTLLYLPPGDDAWEYSPARYWMNGCTYNFAAVYPTDIEASHVSSQNGSAPVFTIRDYDVTTQEDLLVALSTGHDGSDHPDVVELNFKHALSCVQIQLQLDKEDFYELDNQGNILKQVGRAFVSIIGFTDIATVGTLSSPQSEIIWVPSNTNGSVLLTHADNMIEIQSEYKDFLGEGGMLFIPQTLAGGEGELYLQVVIYPLGNIDERITKEYRVPLKSGVSKWEPNVRYIYKAVVTQELVIDFNVTKIYAWEEEPLGGFIVS